MERSHAVIDDPTRGIAPSSPLATVVLCVVYLLLGVASAELLWLSTDYAHAIPLLPLAALLVLPYVQLAFANVDNINTLRRAWGLRIVLCPVMFTTGFSAVTSFVLLAEGLQPSIGSASPHTFMAMMVVVQIPMNAVLSAPFLGAWLASATGFVIRRRRIEEGGAPTHRGADLTLSMLRGVGLQVLAYALLASMFGWFGPSILSDPTRRECLGLAYITLAVTDSVLLIALAAKHG